MFKSFCKVSIRAINTIDHPETWLYFKLFKKKLGAINFSMTLNNYEGKIHKMVKKMVFLYHFVKNQIRFSELG